MVQRTWNGNFLALDAEDSPLAPVARRLRGKVSRLIKAPRPILVRGAINKEQTVGLAKILFELVSPVVGFRDVLRNEDVDLALSSFLDDRFQGFHELGVFGPMADKNGSRFHDTLPSSCCESIFFDRVGLLRVPGAPVCAVIQAYACYL